MKKIVLSLLLAGFLLPVFPIPSFAGGWPTGKGKWLLVPYANYYLARRYWDPSGHFRAYPYNGRFESPSFRVYYEYGITGRLDLVGTVPLLQNHYKDQVTDQSNTSLGDLQIGPRFNILNIRNQHFISLQNQEIIPAYRIGRLPYNGFGEFGTELRLIYSGSQYKHLQYYYDLEAGIRQYFGNTPITQAEYQATLGYYLTAKNQLSLELDGLYSFHNSPAFQPTNPAENTRFRYTKVSLTYGRQISPKVWLDLGVFHDLAGRRIGQGTGVFLFSVIKL